MIYLDDRVGSRDLTSYLTRWGAPHELCRLEFGDAAFVGHGPGGEVDIGVELKTVNEILNYLRGDRSFTGHQLPGLLQNYFMVWLVVEGYFGFDEEGLLTRKQGARMVPLVRAGRRFMHREVAHWMMTMETRAAVRVRRTSSRLETARFLVDLHSWWTAKDWERHTSHLAFDDARPPDGEILLARPGLKRRWAKELPGIGWKKSKEVSQKFPSAFALASAPVEEWLEIPGIGKKLAAKITAAIQEEKR